MDVREVWSGSLPPARAWGFVERLVDEPWSRWRARLLGGDEHWREHLGWSPDTYMAALIADSQRVGNAIADAARVQKRPKIPEMLPRPKAKPKPAADERRELLDDEVRALAADLDM